MESKVILSNRGKLSGGRNIAVVVCALIFLAVGFFLLSLYDSKNGSREAMVQLVGGAGSLAISVFALAQCVMQQKSFLELKADGVCGAALNPSGKGMTITPPRAFELSYAEIQRVDIENGFVLLVTGAITYRCRADSMAKQFVDEIKKQREARS